MERTKHVDVTSIQEKQGIVNTSVQALSTRVVGQAAEMKKRFVAPITNEEGRPSATHVIDRVVNQTEEALDEIAGQITRLEDLQLPYELKVLSTDAVWEEVNGKYQVRVAQVTHNFKKIYSIVAQRKVTNDCYENMVYSYKIYKSGSVAVIVDKKIDIRIVIKGTSNISAIADSEDGVITFTLNKVSGRSETVSFRYTAGMTWRALALNYPNYLFSSRYGPVQQDTENTAVILTEYVNATVSEEQWWIARTGKEKVYLDDVIVGDEYLVLRTS